MVTVPPAGQRIKETKVFRRSQKAAPEGPETADHSLALALPGQKVRITGYQGGRMLRARLLALGLNLGQVVEILQNNRGLIIVSINGGRVALGRGISQKILAEPEV
jgi:Fe2+ transport system protein FeoA